MKKYVTGFFMLIIAVMFFITGCGKTGEEKFIEELENHEAIALYRDGVWEERFEAHFDDHAGRIAKVQVNLSIVVKKDMTEEDVMKVLDYYELRNNMASGPGGGEVRKRTDNYNCYATFYEEGTDKLLWKYKYHNGEIVTPTELEEGIFVGPDVYNKVIEGEDPEELP